MKIIAVDFSGTLIKSSVAEEANLLRFKLLGLPAPSKAAHTRMHATKSHYDLIKKTLERQLKLADTAKIAYVQNHGRDISLSGGEVKTMIMTDLFRTAMYAVAAKKGKLIFQPGMLSALQRLKQKGYTLAIFSGVRTDIISGMLAIATCPVHFDFILGQDPVLSRDDNAVHLRALRKKGRIVAVIGDKPSDIEPAKKLNAQSILVTWGHGTGTADHIITQPKELLRLL